MKLASVIISTKNRKEELRAALLSVFEQSVDVEVIVLDDGSTDGTFEMVEQGFPKVRLEHSDVSLGYIAQRNRGAALAQGEIIFSIDDDAVFISRETISKTLENFDHPRIGAVAIPYVEPKKSNTVFQLAPDDDKVHVTDVFIGTAHALRRDVFLGLGGYRESLVHQGEESDYCIRMLSAGYVVRLGNAPALHHMESPNRDPRRMDYYGSRNNVLFTWQHVPSLYLPIHLPATIWKVATWSLVPSRFVNRSRAIMHGLTSCILGQHRREPVTRTSYRLFRRLRKGGLSLEEAEPDLPVMRSWKALNESRGFSDIA